MAGSMKGVIIGVGWGGGGLTPSIYYLNSMSPGVTTFWPNGVANGPHQACALEF